MTINSPSNGDSDKSRDQCDRDESLHYLLGELSADESSAFESRLADSPELASVLLEQSELICQFAQASDTHAAKTFSPNPSRHWPVARWVEALVTIAACLAIGFFAWKTTGSTQPTATVAQPSEDALIAQAWANTSPQVLTAAITTLDIETEDKWETLEDSDGSSLSWVLAAVESGVSIDG